MSGYPIFAAVSSYHCLSNQNCHQYRCMNIEGVNGMIRMYISWIILHEVLPRLTFEVFDIFLSLKTPTMLMKIKCDSIFM